MPDLVPGSYGSSPSARRSAGLRGRWRLGSVSKMPDRTTSLVAGAAQSNRRPNRPGRAAEPQPTERAITGRRCMPEDAPEPAPAPTAFPPPDPAPLALSRHDRARAPPRGRRGRRINRRFLRRACGARPSCGCPKRFKTPGPACSKRLSRAAGRTGPRDRPGPCPSAPCRSPGTPLFPSTPAPPPAVELLALPRGGEAPFGDAARAGAFPLPPAELLDHDLRLSSMVRRARRRRRPHGVPPSSAPAVLRPHLGEHHVNPVVNGGAHIGLEGRRRQSADPGPKKLVRETKQPQREACRGFHARERRSENRRERGFVLRTRQSTR